MDFFSTPEAADLFFGLTRPSPLCFKSDDERISCLSPAPGAASDAQPTPAALAGECGRADSALPVLQHPSQPPASPDVLSTRLAPSLVRLPDEILLLIAGHLDVDDLLCTSRVSVEQDQPVVEKSVRIFRPPARLVPTLQSFCIDRLPCYLCSFW